ncbi:MAG: hypothetical protein P8X87_06100 [Candidatus Bathyarchaeota archaeon]
MRDAGFISSLEVTKRTIEKTIEYGKLTKADYVVYVDSSLTSLVIVYDLKSGTKSEMVFTEFVENCGGQT